MWPKNGTTQHLRWWHFYMRGGSPRIKTYHTCRLYSDKTDKICTGAKPNLQPAGIGDSFKPMSAVLSVWGQLIFFCFHFYARVCMLSKDMGESFLLSKDEPLTPNIDGVMPLWIFRTRAQNTKIGQKSAKMDLSVLVFIFSPRPPRPFLLIF